MTTFGQERASLTPDAPVTHASWTAADVERRPPTDWWRLGAVAVVWLTSLFVVALWVSGGGLEDLVRFDADTLNTLGRITGLVAANLLLYQVLLMARIPLFERGFGRDGMTRMHRLVGFWSFWLMLAHIVLITIGYAAESGTNVIVQAWQFVWDYPGMLLATAGTLLLILVVITSMRRARKRLRYESWHLLHLYAYVGVGLSIPHMLWTGADFLTSLPATVYWWALWVVSAVSLVMFRVLVPVIRSLRHSVRVASVEPDGGRGVVVRMRGRALERLRAESGQFFLWRFLDGPGWMRGHPFSLAAAPQGDELVISARVLGDGTQRLLGLRSGTRVAFEGPFGRLTGRERRGRKLLMIGAGAGVTPLVSLLESEEYADGEAALIVRDHEARDALRSEAIGDLVQNRGVRYARLDGHRSHGASPWLPQTHAEWAGDDLIRYVAPDLELYDAYVCGPEPWMDSVTKDLRAAGLSPSRIHTERFSI
ncbi:oxidoreductase [Planctomonas sp. JC2975]|uniref:ferredoxin reductase family protein n=1 Tax=Planctomonas sp. JC2975 TaxID=2729626 RepID=UPI00147665E7|nr:ferric reductase-like transmembrane domain-containing protein [Planctomonas sp. JC2975]NNC11159.1 oxidoreductase [Planctomonas sp. JC2975]